MVISYLKDFVSGVCPRFPEQFSNTSVSFIGIIAILLAGIGLGLQMFTMRMGLDISDEAFNYMMIEDVHNMQFALRFQQFILWPLDYLIRSSFTSLRYASFAIGIAILISITIVGLKVSKANPGLIVFLAIVLSSASAIGIDRVWFIRVPTYITVASWGAAVFLIGFILLQSSLIDHWKSKEPVKSKLLLAIVLIVMGTTIAGIARLPTGLVLVLSALFLPILFYVYGSLRLLPFSFLAGLFVGLVSIAVLALLGLTPARFWDLWQTGLELRSKFSTSRPFLYAHWSNLQSLHKIRPDQSYVWAAALAALIFHSFQSRFIKPRGWRYLYFLLLLPTAVLAIYCAWRMTPFGWASYFHRPTFAPEVGVAALSWIALVTGISAVMNQRLPSLFLPSLVAFVLPAAIVFGTGSTIYVQLANSITLFGISMILITLSSRNTILTVIACVFVSGLGLQIQSFGVAKPYRVHGTILENTARLELQGNHNSQIFVHEETAAAYVELQTAAGAAGLVDGTPLLDLTGRRPGMALVLPVVAPVYPWIASGYPNSEDLLVFVWKKLNPKEQSSAWLLGPLHDSFLGDELPPRFRDIHQCYDLVSGVLEPRTGQKLELWKPVDRYTNTKDNTSSAKVSILC